LPTIQSFWYQTNKFCDKARLILHENNIHFRPSSWLSFKKWY